MSIPGVLAAEVRERARERCQYCLMHQALQGATFHIEHVVPRTVGGSSDITNLALACPSCNLHKADRVTGTDPQTGTAVALYHPVKQSWHDHFRFIGYRVEGTTAVGRATVAALDLNHSRRQRIRVAEEGFGLFPHKD